MVHAVSNTHVSDHVRGRWFRPRGELPALVSLRWRRRRPAAQMNCGVVDLCRSVSQVTLESGKPLKRINELEMVQGYVFANVWFDEHLYKIDPATGKVVDSYDFAELYPKVCAGIVVIVVRLFLESLALLCFVLQRPPHPERASGRTPFVACFDLFTVGHATTPFEARQDGGRFWSCWAWCIRDVGPCTQNSQAVR